MHTVDSATHARHAYVYLTPAVKSKLNKLPPGCFLVVPDR